MNISKCCKYSWMSYYPVKPSKKKSIKTIYDRNEINTDKCAKILYIKENDSTYIAFRGTKNKGDIREALKVVPIETINGLVHSGFYGKYLDFKDELEAMLKDDESENIYFTGHSMGGCLALISSVSSFNLLGDILNNKNIYCYMFGSPVVVNRMFLDNAEIVLKSLISIELESDIIPQIPLNPVFKRPSNVLSIKDSNNIINVMKNHSCMAYYKSILKREINDVIKGNTMICP